MTSDSKLFLFRYTVAAVAYYYLPETRGVAVPDDLVEVGILHKRTARMGFWNEDYGNEKTWHELRLAYGEPARNADSPRFQKRPLLHDLEMRDRKYKQNRPSMLD